MLCDKYLPRSHRAGLELISMILFAGMIASGGVAQADELVVDNADATVQVTGRWQANSVSPGFYGGDYLFHLPGDGASTVTWTFPATGVPGRYAVFARWSSGPNRTGEATYVVISDTDKFMAGSPVEALEFDTCIGGGEAPVDAGLLDVSVVHPGSYFANQGGFVGDASEPQLRCQEAVCQ